MTSPSGADGQPDDVRRRPSAGRGRRRKAVAAARSGPACAGRALGHAPAGCSAVAASEPVGDASEPPSTTIRWPVTKSAAFGQRKTHHARDVLRAGAYAAERLRGVELR